MTVIIVFCISLLVGHRLTTGIYPGLSVDDGWRLAIGATLAAVGLAVLGPLLGIDLGHYQWPAGAAIAGGGIGAAVEMSWTRYAARSAA